MTVTFTPPVLTRRSLLGAGAVLAAGTLSGCATAGTTQPTASTTDLSSTDKSLVVSNWALYIDTDDEGPELYPSIAGVPEGVGHHGRVLRGHQRQRGVLRQALPAAQHRAAPRP